MIPNGQCCSMQTRGSPPTTAGPGPQTQSRPEGKSNPEGNRALGPPSHCVAQRSGRRGCWGKGAASCVGDPGVQSGASSMLPIRSQATAPFHTREEGLGEELSSLLKHFFLSHAESTFCPVSSACLTEGAPVLSARTAVCGGVLQATTLPPLKSKHTTQRSPRRKPLTGSHALVVKHR